MLVEIIFYKWKPAVQTFPITFRGNCCTSQLLEPVFTHYIPCFVAKSLLQKKYNMSGTFIHLVNVGKDMEDPI